MRASSAAPSLAAACFCLPSLLYLLFHFPLPVLLPSWPLLLLPCFLLFLLSAHSWLYLPLLVSLFTLSHHPLLSLAISPGGLSLLLLPKIPFVIPSSLFPLFPVSAVLLGHLSFSQWHLCPLPQNPYFLASLILLFHHVLPLSLFSSFHYLVHFSDFSLSPFCTVFPSLQFLFFPSLLPPPTQCLNHAERNVYFEGSVYVPSLS